MNRMKVEVSELCFGYEPEQEVLKNISFCAQGQECIGIIGANGSGKTTLLKMMVGLLFSHKGSIRIGDVLVEKKSLRSIRQRIGYVFQDADSQLFMPTLYEDVAFAPKNHGYSGEELERRVHAALEKVGIVHLRDTPVYKMSGGEKKLASIACVLSMEPDLLLMDEPTSTLDSKNRRNFMNLIKEMPYLRMLVTHDLDMAWDVCDRVILMDEGELIADGRASEILSDRGLLEAHSLELPLCLQYQMHENAQR